MELSFGEQIKILLKRNNMTIQDLANLYTLKTGVKMSRQNLTQRLNRDNFPEQDMRLFASLLGCSVSVQLLPLAQNPEASKSAFPLSAGVPAMLQTSEHPDRAEDSPRTSKASPDREGDIMFQIPEMFRRQKPLGDINPLTGEEYLTNTVRRHPRLPDYVQVYDRSAHEWSDVQEDYFWEFQRNKKRMMGKDYQEPIRI